MDPKNSAILETIPSPDAIRSRLTQLANERALLKSLLRLSQQKEQAASRLKQHQQGGNRAP